MKTYKFITDFLAKNNIEYSKHGGKYYIGRCAVGEDNFYDYGEAEKLLTFYKGYERLSQAGTLDYQGTAANPLLCADGNNRQESLFQLAHRQVQYVLPQNHGCH